MAGTLREFHVSVSEQAGFQTKAMTYEDPPEMSSCYDTSGSHCEPGFYTGPWGNQDLCMVDRGVRVGVRGEGRGSLHRAWQQPALSSQWRQRMHLEEKGRTGQWQLS